ncbi:MAG: galactose mutarotase [Saprospiraceae bacterium]|nr:galactose mutarotase [Saprospiraceae bacterium]
MMETDDPFNLQNYIKTLSAGKIQAFLLQNDQIRVLISNYGAKIISLWVPDRDGNWIDLVAGYDSIDEYLTGSAYYGAVCGRYANRIANAAFHLNDKEYILDANHGKHILHGGSEGFHKKIWWVLSFGDDVLKLGLTSPDGEMGFPGELNIELHYHLINSSLHIQYSAQTNKPTVVNIATHSYFNLQGHGDILSHQLQINAESITEIDSEKIPTGKYIPIVNTSFDFTKSRAIGIQDKDQNKMFDYDHNFILKDASFAAIMSSSTSGIQMKIHTSQPGLQLYTCNWGSKTDLGKNKKNYRAHSFVCLEPQHFPDSPNHPHFPSTVLEPGNTYEHWCSYSFEKINQTP